MEARRATLSALEQLPAGLRRAYGISAAAIVPMKSVTGVVAADGMRYVWKFARARDTDRRLAVISLATAQMADAGLPAAGPLPAQDGRLLATLASGATGYLQPWLPGRHVRFSDTLERLTTVATLASVHQWSSRRPWLFDPAVGGPEWQVLSGGRLERKVNEKWRVLQRIWPLAKAHCTLLDEVETEFQEEGEAVLDALRAYHARQDSRPHPGTQRHGPARDAAVPRPISSAPQASPSSIALCHRDLAPHNLLWLSARWPVALIDFDHAGCDDPLIDLMQVSNHTFLMCDPGPTHFPDLLEAYGRIAPLAPDRRELLFQLLHFPDILIRAVMEWARDDFPANGQARVENAVSRERIRWRRLADAKAGG